MQPITFPEANFDFKKPQNMTEEQCLDLPTFRGEQYILKKPLAPGEKLDPEKLGPDEKFPVVISCWQLSAEEMEEIQRTGKVWLIVTSTSIPPMAVTTHKPTFDGSQTSDEKPLKYIEWLHKLTTLGYNDHTTIRTEHAEIIAGYWQAKQTPEQALENYKKFLLTLN